MLHIGKNDLKILDLGDILASGLSLKTAQSIIVTEILEAFGADSAVFFLRDPKTFSLSKEKTAFINLASQYVDQYITHYSQIDPFIKAAPRAYAYRDIDIMPHRDIQRFEFYQDFMKPQKIQHAVFINMYDDDHIIGQISISRLCDRSHSFSREDLFRAQVLAKLLSLSLKYRKLQERCTACDKLAMENLRNGGLAQERWCLTPKETQIVRCILQGFTNNEICTRLNISLNTVTTHIRHIFEKIDVTSRTKLIHRIMTINSFQ